METENAVIRSTFLGVEDHSILTFVLNLDFGGSDQSYGTFGLDGYDEETKGRKPWPYTSTVIRSILELAQVSEWEKLSGRPIRVARVKAYGWIQAIGNYLKDDWMTITPAGVVRGKLSDIEQVITPNAVE